MNQSIGPLISVVVPVYKVEKYIAECVDSILAQTYHNFELILVDDGSPDNCGAICDAYSRKDNRIQVIHKINGGLSDARNAGIEIAKGEYITFIDSDDFVHKDYLKNMLDAAIQYNADIVQCNFTHEFSLLGGKNKKQKDTLIFNPIDALHDLLKMRNVQVNAWAKLYKLNLFKIIRYPYGRINEDNLTTYKTIWTTKQPVVCLNQYLYYYRVNLDGIMNGAFSLNRYDVLSFEDEAEEYLGESTVYFKPEIEYSEMRLAFRLYNECIQKGKEQAFKIKQDEIYHRLCSFNLKTVPMEPKYRFMLNLLKINRIMYEFMIRYFRK